MKTKHLTLSVFLIGLVMLSGCSTVDNYKAKKAQKTAEKYREEFISLFTLLNTACPELANANTDDESVRAITAGEDSSKNSAEENLASELIALRSNENIVQVGAYCTPAPDSSTFTLLLRPDVKTTFTGTNEPLVWDGLPINVGVGSGEVVKNEVIRYYKTIKAITTNVNVQDGYRASLEFFVLK